MASKSSKATDAEGDLDLKDPEKQATSPETEEDTGDRRSDIRELMASPEGEEAVENRIVDELKEAATEGVRSDISGQLEEAAEIKTEQEASSVFAITIGKRTYNSREEFERVVRKRKAGLKKIQEDEKRTAAEAAIEADSQAYYEAYREKVAEIKGDVAKAKDYIAKAVKLRRNPKNRNSEPGVDDVLEKLVELGYVTKAGKSYRSKEEVRGYFGPVIEQAYQKRRQIISFIHRRNNPNLYTKVDLKNGVAFSCNIETKRDERTHEDVYVVSDMFTLLGKPPFNEGEVPEGKATRELRNALETLKAQKRTATRQKKVEKKKAGKKKNKEEKK